MRTKRFDRRQRMDCPDCGEGTYPGWNGIDWVIMCGGCGWERYPNEEELKEILNLPVY